MGLCKPGGFPHAVGTIYMFKYMLIYTATLTCMLIGITHNLLMWGICTIRFGISLTFVFSNSCCCRIDVHFAIVPKLKFYVHWRNVLLAEFVVGVTVSRHYRILNVSVSRRYRI